MSRTNSGGIVMAVAAMTLTLAFHQSQFPRAVAQGKPSSPGAGQENQERIQKARQLYQVLCRKCHDNDGTGRTMREQLPEIPDFTNGSWQAKRSNIHLRVSILDGRGKLMPSFGGRIGEQQAADLVAIIRLFTPTKKE